MAPRDLVVDTDALRLGGMGLKDAANDIPDPPAAFTETGSDPLSQAIAAKTTEVEAPLIAGLPVTREEALAAAQKVINGAGLYETTDQRIADTILGLINGSSGSPSGSSAATGTSTAASPSSAATSTQSGSSAASSSGSSGSSGLSSLASMPMQVAQQVAQIPAQAAQAVGALPQALMQGVQGAVQQISQLGGSTEDAATEAELDEAAADDESEKPEVEDKPANEAAGDGTREAAPVEPVAEQQDSPEPVRPDPTASTRAMSADPDVVV